MAVVIASDLHKDMGGKPLLEGVSFKLERGQRLTLSGRNGTGKTTLLRMIAGESAPDAGEIVLEKGARVALHDQRPPRETEMSLGDYVLSGATEPLAAERDLNRLEQAMAGGASDQATLARYARAQARLEHAGGYDWRNRIGGVAKGLGFGADDLERPLATLSGGELTRASLARALAAQPDLLLLDEPTNHLDIESLEWLEQTLVGLDAAIVLVAHDRWFLEAVGNAVLELEGGRGRFFEGPWHAWRKERAARELAAGRASERQQAEIERLERFVTRFRAGTRARQAQARVKQLERIVPVGTGPSAGPALGFRFNTAERSGRVVFEMEHGDLSAGSKRLLEDAELWLERGEHVSLVGPNGAGKTTLVHALVGRRPLDSGKLRRGHNVKLAFLSQHAEELDDLATVLEVTQRATGLTPNKARALLGRFLFSGEAADKPISGLSGGERRRLSLAILVQSGANVLVLDEPTNHLDLESREALEEALGAFDGAVLLVSHDRALLDAVGSRTVAIEDRRLRSYEGGWAEYLEVREARRAAEESSTTSTGSPAGTKRGGGRGARSSADGKGRNGSGARGDRNGDGASNGKAGARGRAGPSKNAQREQARLEQAIEKAEAALATLEDELSDPGAWANAERSAKSTERHRAAKEAVDDLYRRLEAVGG